MPKQIPKIIKNIPIIPFSALVFITFTTIFWKIKIIPSPQEMLNFLENLYTSYGLLGLVIATLLEGIVYLGLYFPGSMIIALSVFLSNGSFYNLSVISVIVSLTLTFTSSINYLLGVIVSKRKIKKNVIISKSFFISLFHPNFLAFYFFNAGIEGHNFKNILYVPIFMLPYGFIFGFILFRFSTVIRQGLESPLFLFSIISVWFLIEFIKKAKISPRV